MSVTKKNFPNFFFDYGNLDCILNIFKKKMSVIADVFLNLLILKNLVRWMSKRPVSEHPSTANMVNGAKHFWNLNDSTFTIFIDRGEDNSIGKSLS